MAMPRTNLSVCCCHDASAFRRRRPASSAPGEHIDTFLDTVLFNWVIVGTGAHPKSYSLLLYGEARVRLVLLYAIASALPYPGLDYQKLKLAMRLGSE